MDAFSKAIYNFGCDLLKKIWKNEPNKNICFSPLSIAAVMDMVMVGAGGNTKSQLEKGLHLSDECPGSTKECEEGLHSKIKALQSSQKDKKCDLNIVNALFAENAFTLKDQYVQSVKNLFSAEVQPVDFVNNADAVRQKINEWVKCQTNGKITDLYSKEAIDKTTVLALVNAVYFKGQWASKFDPENTNEGTFHVTKDEEKKVPMMCKSGKYKVIHLPEIKSKALALPYEGDMCLVIVLPDDINGINELLSKATPELINKVADLRNSAETEVKVTIPKFKVEASFLLMQILQEMGMTDLFGTSADLSGISDTKGLAVSSVVHKSCVEVNEDGTEAAAATGAGMSVTSAIISEPESFIANHPFMFTLVNVPDSVVLFKGAIFCP